MNLGLQIFYSHLHYCYYSLRGPIGVLAAEGDRAEALAHGSGGSDCLINMDSSLCSQQTHLRSSRDAPVTVHFTHLSYPK